MRKNFICQLAEPNNGIKRTHLVYDGNPGKQPTNILIDGPDVICDSGDICLVQITVVRRTNGERRSHGRVDP